MLGAAGWAVQDMAAASIHTARGVALREFPLDAGYGFADYLLYVDGKAAGIIEAGDVGPRTIATVPGMPSAFTAAAREAMGARHIHEPLAIGVAVMAARALL